MDKAELTRTEIMIGSSFGPVLDLRIVDGKLQMLREEQELFILEPPVSVPPSPFAKRAPKQVWRDVDEIMPVFRKAEKLRSAVSEAINE